MTARVITAITGFLMLSETWPKILGEFQTFGGKFTPPPRCLDKTVTIILAARPSRTHNGLLLAPTCYVTDLLRGISYGATGVMDFSLIAGALCNTLRLLRT